MNGARIAGAVVVLAAVLLLGLLGGWPPGSCTELQSGGAGSPELVNVSDQEVVYSVDGADTCSVELWHIALLGGLGVLAVLGLVAVVRG